MDAPGLDGLDHAARRRLYRRAVLRPLATVTALIVLYCILPLDRIDDLQLALVLVTGLLAIVGLCVWQVRAIQRSRYPAVQAVEALATTVPMFLLLFAAAYFLMSHADNGDFNAATLIGPTRSTSPSPSSPRWASATCADHQVARLVVTAQMVGNLWSSACSSERSPEPSSVSRARRRNAPAE